MKTKKLMCGIAALLLMALAAGCSARTTAEETACTFKAAAEPAGFDAAASRLFALAGDCAAPVPAAKGIPPEITGCGFAEADKLAASFSFGGGGMPARALSIVWNKNIDRGFFTAMQGWSISSDGGDIDFMMLMLSDSQTAMVILSRAPASGEVITIMYDGAVGLIRAAKGGAKLAGFTTMIAID